MCAETDLFVFRRNHAANCIAQSFIDIQFYYIIKAFFDMLLQ